jgi:hypothetical protein
MDDLGASIAAIAILTGLLFVATLAVIAFVVLVTRR